MYEGTPIWLSGLVVLKGLKLSVRRASVRASITNDDDVSRSVVVDASTVVDGAPLGRWAPAVALWPPPPAQALDSRATHRATAQARATVRGPAPHRSPPRAASTGPVF